MKMGCTMLIKERNKVFSEEVLHVTVQDTCQLFHVNYLKKCALMCAEAFPHSNCRKYLFPWSKLPETSFGCV